MTVQPLKIPPESASRKEELQVKRGATIGANVTIVCGVTIGEQAFIGAGSVVIRNVPSHALVVGNPARRIGWVCDCSVKLPRDLRCTCGRKYQLLGDDEGLVRGM